MTSKKAGKFNWRDNVSGSAARRETTPISSGSTARGKTASTGSTAVKNDGFSGRKGTLGNDFSGRSGKAKSVGGGREYNNRPASRNVIVNWPEGGPKPIRRREQEKSFFKGRSGKF